VTLLNAVLMPMASLPMPVVAPKVTIATTNAYSTRSCLYFTARQILNFT
jgi:hypothetical protein